MKYNINIDTQKGGTKKMIATFFITQTGNTYKVVDDLNRNYGEFNTKQQAEIKCKELSEKFN